MKLTLSEVNQLAKEAQEKVDAETACKGYADILPAVMPIIEAGGRFGISDAVDFLIAKGVVKASNRNAAKRGLERARKDLREKRGV